MPFDLIAAAAAGAAAAASAAPIASISVSTLDVLADIGGGLGVVRRAVPGWFCNRFKCTAMGCKTRH